MKFDDLFEQRSLVASKLEDCIRDSGHTKVSFSKKSDISRPTLDKILRGQVNNKSTFDRHIKKILEVLDMSVDELMLYHSDYSEPMVTVYSNNAPVEHKMSNKAKKQMELLLDVVDLCSIYY